MRVIPSTVLSSGNSQAIAQYLALNFPQGSQYGDYIEENGTPIETTISVGASINTWYSSDVTRFVQAATHGAIGEQAVVAFELKSKTEAEYAQCLSAFASSNSDYPPTLRILYAPAIGPTRCLPCGAGSFSNITAATACMDCAAGKYVNTTGATACLVCAGNGTSTTCDQVQTPPAAVQTTPTAPAAPPPSFWNASVHGWGSSTYKHCTLDKTIQHLTRSKSAGEPIVFATGGLGRFLVANVYEVWICLSNVDHPCARHGDHVRISDFTLTHLPCLPRTALQLTSFYTAVLLGSR